MRILVTGGAGFIGSHLCEALLEQGHHVTAIDDFSTGSADNLLPITGYAPYANKFRLVVDSILSFNGLEEIVKEVDLIYHLAAAVGVKLIVNDPINTISTNIRGTEILTHLANKWRKPLIFTSTSEVYGKNTSPSFSETDDMVLGATTQARWSYACSKAIDEFLILAYNRKNRLPCIVVRLFNTVGPRQTSQYGMVIPTFVRQALRGEPITVYGDGTQTRTFCHVADVIKSIVSLPTFEKAYGEVFNIGGNQEISIFDLAQLIKKKTNSDSSIIKIPYASAYAPGFEDMPRRVPNISKLSILTGYTPHFSLENIIETVADYFQAHPSFL